MFGNIGSGAPSWSWASIGGPIEMLSDGGTRLENPSVDLTLIQFSAYPDKEMSNNSTTVVFARLLADAYCFRVWCQCRAKDLPPYNDHFLRMVIDIFDENGNQVGTGYWDEPDKPDIQQCTAVVICQRVEEISGVSPVTYFLLTETRFFDKYPYKKRIWIGYTLECSQGRVFGGFDFEGRSREHVRIILGHCPQNCR